MGLLGGILKIGSSIIGGKKAKKAITKAADARVAGLNDARGQLTDFVSQVQSDYQPYTQVGETGAGVLQRLLSGDQSAFTKSPGYQFRVDEALKGVDRNAATQGLYNSGGRLKALMDRAGEVASSEYNNFFDQIMRGTSLGGNALGAQTGYVGQATGRVADIATGIGDTRASQYLGRNAATRQMIGGITEGIGDVFGGGKLKKLFG